MDTCVYSLLGGIIYLVDLKYTKDLMSEKFVSTLVCSFDILIQFFILNKIYTVNLILIKQEKIWH